MVGGKRGVVCRCCRCMVCRWGRCVICRGRSMVGRLGRRMVGCHLLVMGSSLIGHLGDVPVDVVRCVVHMLRPAVGQGNRVRTGDCTMFIGALSGVIRGLGVVVGHCIFIAVWLRWLFVVWLRGVVDRLGWCMVHGLRWCVVCWGVDHRGMMNHWRMDQGSMVYSMVSHGCMMDCSMMNRGVMDCSVVDRGVMDCCMVYRGMVDCCVVNRGMMN